MKNLKILYFIKQSVPTIAEQEEAEALGPGVVFRNALFVPETGSLEKCDGVCGEVPSRYAAAYPDGEKAISAEQDRLKAARKALRDAEEAKKKAKAKAVKEVGEAREAAEAAKLAKAEAIKAEKAAKAAEAKAKREAKEAEKAVKAADVAWKPNA